MRAPHFNPWLSINNGAREVSFTILEDINFGADIIRVKDEYGVDGHLSVNTESFYPAVMWWMSRHRDQIIKGRKVTFVDNRQPNGRGVRIE